jgi:hypothetical protein
MPLVLPHLGRRLHIKVPKTLLEVIPRSTAATAVTMIHGMSLIDFDVAFVHIIHLSSGGLGAKGAFSQNQV